MFAGKKETAPRVPEAVFCAYGRSGAAAYFTMNFLPSRMLMPFRAFSTRWPARL